MLSKKWQRLLVAVVLTLGNLAVADDSIQNALDSDVPAEAVALMESPHYLNLMAALRKTAHQNGMTLRVSDLSVLDFDGEVYAYVALDAKSNAAQVADEWASFGIIVGVVKYGPQGDILIEGAYFKPAISNPGGASVGN